MNEAHRRFGPREAARLVVFSKIPGELPAKTRLVKTGNFTPDDGVRFASALLADTLKTAAAAAPEGFILASDPPTTEQQLLKLFSELPAAPAKGTLQLITYLPQPSTGFDQRLQELAESLVTNAAGVVFIGSDAPLLPPETIQKALQATENGRFALAPAPRGGVCIIGVPQAALENGFSFSNAFAAESQCAELSKRGEQVGVSTVMLPDAQDIDVADDLKAMLATIKANPELTPLAANSLSLARELLGLPKNA